jgi:heme-degrading monooxygenase HmoA
MIRHVALFTWTEGMTDAMEQQFAAELTALASRLPGVRGYRAGADAGINEGNFDFAVVADFDDADSYRAYRDSAEHRDIIGRFSGPNTKSRAAVQYGI